MVNIYTDGFVSLDTTDDQLIFKIIDENTVYNENGYNTSLEYIRQTWKHAVLNNIKYTFIIDVLLESNVELPLPAYLKLINMLMDIHSDILSNCLNIFFITKSKDKWKGVYDFVTKLWNPLEEKPIYFIDKYEDIEELKKTN